MSDDLDRVLERLPDREARTLRALCDLRQTHLGRAGWSR